MTMNSIISPASQNFVVGLKPTVGLISRSGIIPISQSQDTPGPVARSVADIAILLGVLTGVDKQDPVTLSSDHRSFHDYTSFLDASFLKSAE